MDNLEHLKYLADIDFDGTCVWAENNIDSVKHFLDTWSKNCGAPKAVFVGHVVKMLIELNSVDKEDI